jgi:L-malate glycosyltransferase
LKEIKTIAIVCNYELKPDRVGGMDRFFKAYNMTLLEEGKRVCWFFSGGEFYDFYKGFDLHFSASRNVEKLFLDYLEGNEPFDGVVTHFVALCTPFYKKIQKKGVKKIIAVDHNPRPINGFPWKKRVKNKIKGILFGDCINCLVGVSQYTANSILKDYGRNLATKTVVIYNGIDTSIYQKRTETNHGKFLVVSHLRESKGIQDLIEAVYSLEPPLKKMVEIDIFGEGPYEHILRNHVQKYKLQPQIRFKGSTADLPELFQHYSYMVLPTYMECFSLSILESLAANIPVITTPVGGNLEVVRDNINGFIFPPNDVLAIKKLLEEILCGSIRINEDVSFLVQEKYSLQQMIDNHMKILSI